MPKKIKKLKLLFIADPFANFDPIAETTTYLMREANRRGHGVYWMAPENISAKGSQLFGPTQKLQVLPRNQRKTFKILSVQHQKLSDFDAILLRKDPPFDFNYLQHLYLLENLSQQVYMMNHPHGIMVASEKLFPLPFQAFIPKTLISANQKELLEFVGQQKQGSIIKPLGSSGGRGVFYFRSPKAENISVILETATENFTRHVVAQAFIPQVKKGDKRILLIGPEILGAFLRKPAAGEHRANLHSGGKAYPAKVTAHERNMVAALVPELQRLGLDFVGLDLIGPYLIEVNVTSPMGIHELNATSSGQSEIQVIDFIEKKI